MMRNGLILVALVWGCDGLAAATLQEQLRDLGEQRGFVIEGLGRLGEEPAGNGDGSVQDQIRHLLQGYNYVVIQAGPGVIGKIRIISRRGETAASKGSAGSAYVQTKRAGAHHQVDVVMVGPNSVARTLPLMIDTGASTLVLPSSMMAELGFTPEDLREGTSQTASGTVSVRIGSLRSVRVGAVAADNVEVSFIDDSKISDGRLLGMSFLQHFKMTIDDAANELVLMAK
jgi:aspartyl protease family protein